MAERGAHDSAASVRWAAFAYGGALLCCFAFYAAAPLSVLFSQVSDGFNEGWNAYFAVKVLRGEALYPPIESLILNNYPPLSFYIVASATPFVGDPLFAGRLVALAALLITAGAIGRIVQRATASRLAGAAAGLLMLAIIAGQYQIYVAYDDPQMLAHALMALGALFLTKEPLKPRDVVLASVLMLAGGFTKHMLLSAPIAATIWLYARDRRLFLTWIIAGALGAAAALGLCYALYSAQFFTSVIGHQREWSFGLALLGMTGLAPIAPIILFAFFVMSNRESLRSAAGFLAIATALSAVLAILTKSGRGVDVNAYFDVVIWGIPAAVLAIVSLGERLAEAMTRRRVQALLWLILAAPAISPLPMRAPMLRDALEARSARIASAAGMINHIAAIDGPVACERIALCYWAGKEFAFDWFNVSEAAVRSPVFRDGVIGGIRAGEIAAFQLNSDGALRESPLLAEIRAHYDIRFEDPYFGEIRTPRRRR